MQAGKICEPAGFENSLCSYENRPEPGDGRVFAWEQKCLCRKEIPIMVAFVDQDLCTGCEVCPDICPSIFFMTANGKATAVQKEIPADLEDCCSRAKNECPTQAISIGSSING